MKNQIYHPILKSLCALDTSVFRVAHHPVMMEILTRGRHTTSNFQPYVNRNHTVEVQKAYFITIFGHEDHIDGYVDGDCRKEKFQSHLVSILFNDQHAYTR